MINKRSLAAALFVLLLLIPGIVSVGTAEAYQAVCIDCGFVLGWPYCATWYRSGFARCILGGHGFVCWGTCTLEFLVSE